MLQAHLRLVQQKICVLIADMGCGNLEHQQKSAWCTLRKIPKKSYAPEVLLDFIFCSYTKNKFDPEFCACIHSATLHRGFFGASSVRTVCIMHFSQMEHNEADGRTGGVASTAVATLYIGMQAAQARCPETNPPSTPLALFFFFSGMDISHHCHRDNTTTTANARAPRRDWVNWHACWSWINSSLSLSRCASHTPYSWYAHTHER